MLDDNDIQKLKSAFATKEDFKEDFSTKKEIEYLIDIVATKEEMNNLASRLDGRMGKMDERMGGIENILKKMDEKLDEVVKTSKDVEYIKNILNIPAMKN